MAIVLLIKTVDGNVSDLPVLNTIIIGRSSSSDYKISDNKLSGTHCKFELTNKGQLLFKDLGSTNGSFLNNSQVQEVHVKIHDIIRIGDTTIRIDEKRLSPSDKTAIGVSKVKQESDKTLPDHQTRYYNKSETEAAPSSKKSAKPKAATESGEEKKRPTIGLSKKMKEEKERDKEARQNDKIKWTKNIVEVEKSTGKTQALKLDEEIKKRRN